MRDMERTSFYNATNLATNLMYKIPRALVDDDDVVTDEWPTHMEAKIWQVGGGGSGVPSKVYPY